MKPNSALTTRWNGIVPILHAEVGVSEPFVPPNDVVDIKITVAIKKYRAIWDTGATHSVITAKVVEDLKLTPMGYTVVHTANGETRQKQYIANLYLPNQVMFGMLKVTEAPLHEADILIGMDIISKGDLCISNFEGRTMLTFRVPSCQSFDFVQENQITRLPRAERRRIEKERGKI